jgi:hypothetical protein
VKILDKDHDTASGVTPTSLEVDDLGAASSGTTIPGEIPNPEDKPVLSQHVLSLWAEVKEVQDNVNNIFNMLGPDSLDYKAAREKLDAFTDIAYARQTAELLGNCLGLTPVSALAPIGGDVLSHVKTIHKKDTHLAVFDVGSVGGVIPTLLARGYVSGHHHKHWYLLTTCEEHLNEIPFRESSSAYVRLKHEKIWYGRHRLTDVVERRTAFASDVTAAYEVTALCEQHRHPDTPVLVSDEADET